MTRTSATQAKKTAMNLGREFTAALVVALMVSASAVAGTTQDDAQAYAPGRVLVKLSAGEARAADETLLPGVRGLRSLDPAAAQARSAGPAWFVAELDESTTVEAAIDALAELAEVEYVEPDYILRAPEPFGEGIENAGLGIENEAGYSGSATNDPHSGEQYALDRIQAAAAWSIQGGSTSIIVAVVDTGVQLGHPDLRDRIWTNPNETANGQDDDGNGFVDDVSGWNFISNNNDPSDDNSHGSHCAGIIAAVRDNNIGIAGAANVSLMAVKSLDDQMSGTTSTVMEGFRYAMNNGAHVVSMSLGGSQPSQAFSELIAEAAGRGIVAVAATGNAGGSAIDYPAGYENVIAVGATDQNDQLATFSNGGAGIDLVAPGVDILSTVTGSDYGNKSGTSMSTPYVAAVAALVRSANPSLGAAAVEARLTGGADDLGTAGYDTLHGHGRGNALRALGGDTGEPTSDPTPTTGGDDEFEPNNTSDQAKEIQLGTYVLRGNDEDWFFVRSAGALTITVDGSIGDLDLYVFAESGEELASSKSDYSKEKVQDIFAGEGIYIAVTPYNGLTADYMLTITATGDTAPATPFPTDLLVVPGACGMGAVQMMAAMIVGLAGLTTTIRRRR